MPIRGHMTIPEHNEVNAKLEAALKQAAAAKASRDSAAAAAPATKPQPGKSAAA